MTRYLTAFPDDEALQKTWASTVIGTIVDPEESVRNKALDAIEEKLFIPLVEFANNPQLGTRKYTKNELDVLNPSSPVKQRISEVESAVAEKNRRKSDLGMAALEAARAEAAEAEAERFESEKLNMRGAALKDDLDGEIGKDEKTRQKSLLTLNN